MVHYPIVNTTPLGGSAALQFASMMTSYHRRYNAAKPLNPESNFAQLYGRAAAGAALRDPTPHPLVPLGKRNANEQELHDRVYSKLRPTNVEPPFMPKYLVVVVLSVQ